jgi:hypothetical protein
MNETSNTIREIKELARYWNELYEALDFDQMKLLATEDVGIANATSTDPSPNQAGLIIGRDAYFKGIYDTYYGMSKDGRRLDESNLLVMNYEDWEYISTGNDEESFYTIGTYTIYWSDATKKPYVGVNCWLLKKVGGKWLIDRVINT